MQATFAHRIEVNPRILSGRPIIKGTRIPVRIILQMLRDGASFGEIMQEYPKVTVADIHAVLDYAMYKINPDIDEEIPLGVEE